METCTTNKGLYFSKLPFIIEITKNGMSRHGESSTTQDFVTWKY